MAQKILLVDDDPDLVEVVRKGLVERGYHVVTASGGSEGFAAALEHRPDLIILDIVMPRMDGIQVLQRLRRHSDTADTPVLFLTARSSVSDRVLGLEHGADDYLVKPFYLQELLAQVSTLLRRGKRAVSETAAAFPGGNGKAKMVDLGDVALNLESRRAFVRGEEIRLTKTECDLLAYLMTHAGEVLSSQELLQQVWGFPQGTTDTGLVRWHVRNLRSKIETDPEQPEVILTISRRGYVFAGGEEE